MILRLVPDGANPKDWPVDKMLHRKLVPLSVTKECPYDGQTLAWHMKEVDRGQFEGMLFGDYVGCNFIETFDRIQHKTHHKRE